MSRELFGYQCVGRDFLAATSERLGSALCFDSPGLGKSAEGIAVCPREAPIVVISPASVKGCWLDEFAAWQGRDCLVLSGRGAFRWPETLPGWGEVLIVNPEILPPSPREIADLRKKIAEAERPPETLDFARKPGDPAKLRAKLAQLEELRRNVALKPPPRGMVLLVDECQFARSNKTATTKRLRWLVKEVRKRGGKSLGLTGTPLLNKPLELWSILTTFQLHKPAFPGGWFEFLRAFGGHPGRFGLVFTEPRDELVGAALRRVAIRRRYEDVASDVPPYLPPQRIVVPIDEKTVARCDAALAWLTASGRSIESLVGMESIPFEEISRARAALALAKLPYALEIVAQYEEDGEPLVVAGYSVAPIQAIGKRPGAASITGETPAAERSRIVAAFQAGELRVIAISKAAWTGITLHRAAHMLRIDRSFVPADNEQAPARLRRTGQTRPVMVRDLVADHILDRRLDEILSGKERFVAAVDAMAGAPTR